MKTKIIASALFALLVATMMISNVKAADATPQSLLLELEETVREADNRFFRGYPFTYTKQLKDALSRKIHAVIKMMDKGDYEAAVNKLNNDIAHKLTICDTTRVRALSWLSYDPLLHEAVHDFSNDCQVLINRAIILLT